MRAVIPKPAPSLIVVLSASLVLQAGAAEARFHPGPAPASPPCCPWHIGPTLGAALAAGATVDASISGGLFVANYSPRGRGMFSGMPAAIILFGLEGLYQPRRSTGEIRGYAAFGIVGFSLGPSIVGVFGEKKDLALGPELMYHIELAAKKPLVLLQLFARGDFFVRAEHGHQAVIGARLAWGF